ncbi:MAG TPA: carbon starvation CstA family protein [Kofleriaceae bacterium]|nr:carbon starvation CstA family protein [Kofleriaceae bacterium]
MSLALLAGVFLVVLALGYRFYGGLIARRYQLDPGVKTPAVRLEDGRDFVPTRPFYLMGQHFSAIAAAGPIAGPILACQQFGWGPCVLWIGFGVIFIGAVHDFSALVASVRHDARSIAEVVRVHLGRNSWLAIMSFIWLALIYVIIAFVDLTAGAFTSKPGPATSPDFNPGGAVALAGTTYIGLAVVMGLVDKFLRPPLWLQTIIFVPATLVLVWLGTHMSQVLLFSWTTWVVLILIYCFVASLVPMWALLQPRGYLGGFVLYMALAVGVAGIFFGGFEVKQPAFTGFQSSATGAPVGYLFPFLFVTIACGACSGFHGLVCTGTTSKQIATETDCKPIGYGAMLLEGFVAIIALGTIMIASKSEIAGLKPDAVYSLGLGRFLTSLIGEQHAAFATTFAAMALSTFIFDTIDVGTRLGRYILQELFHWEGRVAAAVTTGITVGLPLVVLLGTGSGSFRTFWTLFGSSNQLLAGLTLLAVTVWLRRSGRRAWYTLLPTVFILLITLVALVLQTYDYFRQGGTLGIINGVVAVVLMALAVQLIINGVRALRETGLPAARAVE